MNIIRFCSEEWCCPAKITSQYTHDESIFPRKEFDLTTKFWLCFGFKGDSDLIPDFVPQTQFVFPQCPCSYMVNEKYVSELWYFGHWFCCIKVDEGFIGDNAWLTRTKMVKDKHGSDQKSVLHIAAHPVIERTLFDVACFCAQWQWDGSFQKKP